MGRCQRAGTSKNKKVTENFSPASIFALGSGVKILLKNHIFCHKWPIMNVILVLIT